MRIFVVGGTGVLGKRVVEGLVQNNHKLLVLSRSKEKSKWIKEIGAEPVEGNIFDKNQMISCANNQEGIVNLATHIPKKMKTKPLDWKETCKIREEGKNSLIEASLINNCKFFIQESFLLVYGNQNGKWVDELVPVSTPVPLAYNLNPGFHNILNNAVLAEQLVNKAYKERHLPSIILRYENDEETSISYNR